ncbi:MAG: response regulator, partial [Paramuribaculum sp.]|nr:response regulator [Paramuribaculum sp.]
SQLSVLSREVRPGDGSGVLACALPYAKEIRLRPDQSSFSLRVATADYVNNSTAYPFQYRLDGVDNDWLTADNGIIHYTNLDPGNYTLTVRRDPEHSNDPDGMISLKVVVEHPWYATWWAILIYIVIAGTAIWFIVVKTRDFTRLKLSLRKEKLERQQIEKLNQEKLVFFTNVSHEFQTPLTLIMSHIDLLLSKTARNERLSASLRRVRTHAEQMSHLITQLLEFRKLQQNHQTIRIGRRDASELLRKSAEPFVEYAGRRNIEFRIDVPDQPVEGYFDPQLIDRVLVNLISNAFKYTPDGGRIECKISSAANGDVVIRCADNGKGISEQDLPFIFDRFYNGSADEIKYNDLHYKTTGIGLAFAKSIVDSHHGTIGVESKVNEGTVFTVTLPGRKEVFDGDRNVVFSTAPAEIPDAAVAPQTLPVSKGQLEESDDDMQSQEGDEERPTLLIVEDNLELRHNLSVFFSAYYNVVLAEDGVQGLKKAAEVNPDIVISDVLMPNMDGTEMCRRIKSDMALCHIPVILLTALSATESRLDGLNANADDYVTKPYDSSVLLARVDNLLRNRRLLRSQFDKKPVSEIDITVVNPLDRDLLKRTSELIDARISDPELDIPQLCTELGISRSLFYTKFKSLTGMTPSAFILNYRLKHEAALLTAQPHLSVTEVADQTGFTATVYFSRCFKKQFGVPPQKYRSAATATL